WRRERKPFRGCEIRPAGVDDAFRRLEPQSYVVEQCVAAQSWVDDPQLEGVVRDQVAAAAATRCTALATGVIEHGTVSSFIPQTAEVSSPSLRPPPRPLRTANATAGGSRSRRGLARGSHAREAAHRPSISRMSWHCWTLRSMS